MHHVGISSIVISMLIDDTHLREYNTSRFPAIGKESINSTGRGAREGCYATLTLRPKRYA